MILYDPRYNIKRYMSEKEMFDLFEASGLSIKDLVKSKNKGKKILGIYHVLDDNTPLKCFKKLYREVVYEDEAWIPLKENPEMYMISSYGRIKRYYPVGKTYDFILPYMKSHSHSSTKKVTMRKWLVSKIRINNKYSEVATHLLVAKNFLEEPIGFKDPVTFHINGIVWDNRVSNLKFIERREASSVSGGMSRSKPVKCIDTLTGEITYYKSGREAARNLFVSYQTIFDNINGKSKLAGFRYKIERDDE